MCLRRSLFFYQHSVNSLLTWIGLGIGLNQLTLQLILGYVFYPLAFLIGVPRAELLPVARLLATKFVANELVAYTELQALMKTDAALSARAYTITTYVYIPYLVLVVHTDSSTELSGMRFVGLPISAHWQLLGLFLRLPRQREQLSQKLHFQLCFVGS